MAKISQYTLKDGRSATRVSDVQESTTRSSKPLYRVLVTMLSALKLKIGLFKLSNFKMHMTAKFEIISMTEIVDEQYPDMQVPNHVLCKLYKGALVPAITSGAIDSVQKWGVTIITKARADNGDIHTHEVSWSTDDEMTFTEFLRGKKEYSVNIGSGLRVPWRGINQQWIDMVDCDLADMTAISAWATANCLATVNTKGLSQFSINQLKKKFKGLNAKAKEYAA